MISVLQIGDSDCELRSPFNLEFVRLLKSCSEKSYNPQKKAWKLPLAQWREKLEPFAKASQWYYEVDGIKKFENICYDNVKIECGSSTAKIYGYDQKLYMHLKITEDLKVLHTSSLYRSFMILKNMQKTIE